MESGEGNDKATPLTSNEVASSVSPGGSSDIQASGDGNEAPGGDFLGKEPRRGHVCCGCCCDTRRAVIIVDFITISFAFLSMLMISAFTSDSFIENLDDDEAQDALSSLDSGAVGLTILIGFVAIACCSFGIYGAISFKVAYIGVGMLWHSLEALRSIFFLDLPGLALSVGFIYPHFFLIKDINNGNMTKGSYPIREEKCCCV